jgi:hypothetical protein
VIALYKGVSAMSRMIRFRTWSEYSHASWVDDSFQFEWESWPKGGVQSVAPFSRHTRGTVVDLFHVPLSRHEETRLLEFFASQKGKGYDWRGVFGFLSRRSAAQSREKWFCSELIFRGFEVAGRPLLARVPAWKVDPGMLALSPLLTLKETRKAGGEQNEEADPVVRYRALGLL